MQEWALSSDHHLLKLKNKFNTKKTTQHCKPIHKMHNTKISFLYSFFFCSSFGFSYICLLLAAADDDGTVVVVPNDFKQNLREWLFQIFLLTWYSIRNRPYTETTYNKNKKKIHTFLYNKVSEYIFILKIHI